MSLKARPAAERQLDRMTSRLVAALADRGGCELYAGGKRVWFELEPRDRDG